MRKKGVWKIVVVLAVLVTIGSCAAMTVSGGLGILPDYPEIKEPQHNIEGIGYNSTQIHSTAVFYNPNIFPLKFKKVEYSLFVNDILIGSGQSEEDVLILPRSEKKLAFESEIYQKSILKWLKERIKTRENTTVNIKGDITFDLGIFEYKHPINISVTEIWKKRFNNSFSFTYPVTDLTGDKISEMIIDVWTFEDGYISGEVRVVDGVDGSLFWNRSLGAGIPVAYPATDLNGDNITDFIVNVWDIDRNWATQILVLDGVNGSELWKWEDEDGLAAAYPCTDFNGDKITEIVVNSYSFIEEEGSTPAATSAQHDDSRIQVARVKGVNSASRISDSNVSFGFEVSTSEKSKLPSGIENTKYVVNVPNSRNLIPKSPNQIDRVPREENKFNLTTMRSLGDVFFTDDYADYGIDMNGDGKYDYLAIEVGVNVKKAGKYSVEGSLYDRSTGDYIVGTSTDRILDVGMQNVTLRFNGYQIYRHGTSGRFDLEDLEVYDKDWNMLDHRDYAYTTSYYGFTAFDAPPADIIGSYSNYGIDTDGDGKYNCLAIDVWVNVKEAGTYWVYGRLDDSNGKRITSEWDEAYLSTGLQKFTLKFNGYDIYRNGVNGPFSLGYTELDDEEGNREIDHRHNAYTTSFYYYTDFDKPPADLTGSYSECGIDADGDGKYDYLTIDVWISVKEVGYYNLQGWLDDCHGYGINSDWNGTYLKEGLQKLTLEFDGYEIYRYGVSGSFILGRVKLLDDDWNAVDDKWDVYTTSYFAYTDFDKPPTYLTGAYADYGVDADGNGKYDYLAIDVGVNVKEDGKYNVYGQLNDQADEYVTSDGDEVDLSRGLQKFTLQFGGYKIYRNGVDGPFLLRYVELYDEWNRADYKYDAYITSYYNHAEFDRKFTGNFNDYGVDTDEDGLYDHLEVEVEINVTKEGEYELEGDLQYYNEKEGYWEGIDSDWNETYLEVGIQNITLQFDGIRIYNSKYSGCFRVWLRLYETEEGNRIDEIEYFTNDYDYMDFRKPPAEFAPGFNDYGLDTDGDSVYDYLVIEKEIKVREAGNYRLSGWLESPSGEWIGSDSNYTYLDVGLHSMKFQFYGPDIYNSGESGKFNVDMDLYDTKDGRRLDSTTSTTSYYSYTDFEKPPAEFAPGFNAYGLDTDGNSLYDYLVIEKEIIVREAGNYRLSGSLESPSREWIDYDSNSTYLDVGLENVQLQFYGPSIYNSEESGNFDVDMDLYDVDNDRILDSTTNTTSYYNYTDFERSPAEFTGNFDDYGLDTDGDGLYNYLAVEAEVNITKAGEYRLRGNLYKEGTLTTSIPTPPPEATPTPPTPPVDYDSNRTYLETGIHNIILRFDGIEIYTTEYNGSFRTWLGLQETEEWRELDEEEYFTTSYDYTEFQKPPAEFAFGFNDYGLDTDGNSLYDYLIIEKEIIVREAGNYRLSGSLESPSGEWIDYDSNFTYLNVGLENVQLQFYGPSIYNSEESGNFDVDMDLYDVDNDRILDSTTNTTSYYSYTDLERSPAEFTGNFDDYGLDIGEDSLYNYLVVEAEINVTKAGEYRLSGILRYYDENDGYWEYIGGDWNRTYLEASINNITLKFDGWRIYNSEYNGSFKAELQLYDTEARIDEAEYNTSHYNYTDFNPSPPVEIPVTEIYVFDGSNGAQLWNISIRNCLAAAYPISDIDGDNVSELLINKWLMEGYEAAFSKMEIVKGTDASELWNKSFANCFAVAYPVTDLNGDNVTELVVDTWRFDRPEPITEIFVIDGNEGSFLWNRSISVGYLAAAYSVTDFTGDNITELAINAFNEIPSTIIEVVDGVNGTLLWSKTINNSLSAVYPATDLTKDGTSELIINSWLFSNGILSESGVLIVNGLDGAILWNFSASGMAVTYPATDLTNNNVSEIIMNVWGPELESTRIVLFEGLTHTELFSKTMSNSLAAAYPVSDLTGDNISEMAVNELNFKKEAANITIVSIRPSAK